MKLPRNVNGDEMVKGPRRVGYERTRQTGDHVYMTTQQNSEHHVSVPLHNPIRVGTLSTILSAVAAHLRLERNELIRRMKL